MGRPDEGALRSSAPVRVGPAALSLSSAASPKHWQTYRTTITTITTHRRPAASLHTLGSTAHRHPPKVNIELYPALERPTQIEWQLLVNFTASTTHPACIIIRCWPAHIARMDTLVTRYSRPAALQRETHYEDSFDNVQDDMAPSLSLKFAMPPVAQVSSPP